MSHDRTTDNPFEIAQVARHMMLNNDSGMQPCFITAQELSAPIFDGDTRLEGVGLGSIALHSLHDPEYAENSQEAVIWAEILMGEFEPYHLEIKSQHNRTDPDGRDWCIVIVGLAQKHPLEPEPEGLEEFMPTGDYEGE